MILTHANIAKMNAKDGAYGLIQDGAIVVSDDKILWVGTSDQVPHEHRGREQIDLEGRLMTPAFVDCHTHIVHGGNRAGEFEMRLEGASYEDIARAGGGIVSTVNATRIARLDELVSTALPRVDALLAEGVSTIEIKSGYGLDCETELNMLRAARAIGKVRPIKIVTSFLGAHALPDEYAADKDGYIDDVCLPTLEAASEEGLVDAVDGFCEGIAFSPEQIERVFIKARNLGLPVKLHAEQLSHLGGTKLAVKYGALSVDHLEYATAHDAKLMADAGTIAVMLPGAFYTLREQQLPPLNAFREHGVSMALATDCNPGSSPLSSLLLTMNMGCTLFGLTPQEALAGVTSNAARALGLTDTGVIAPGMRADLAVWNVEQPAELSYRVGFNPLHKRFFGGLT